MRRITGQTFHDYLYMNGPIPLVDSRDLFFSNRPSLTIAKTQFTGKIPRKRNLSLSNVERKSNLHSKIMDYPICLECNRVRNWRLSNYRISVTLEPKSKKVTRFENYGKVCSFTLSPQSVYTSNYLVSMPLREGSVNLYQCPIALCGSGH